MTFFDKHQYFTRIKEIQLQIQKLRDEYSTLKERYYQWQIEELNKQLEKIKK